MTTQIKLYEKISTLSQRMVDAAQANNWDRLVELERRVAALRNELIANDASLALSTPELLHKQSLIQQILEDDAEIRRHTEPWMERVRHFLGAQKSRPATVPTTRKSASAQTGKPHPP
ncbi:MAG TPA: flagellar protein FliT [Rugosibacter sp.]